MARRSDWRCLFVVAVTASGCVPWRGSGSDTGLVQTAPTPPAASALVQRVGHSVPDAVQATSPIVQAAAPPASKWPQHVTQPPRAAEETRIIPPLPETGPQAPMLTALTSSPKLPVVLALDCVLQDRHHEALQHLQAYDPHTQEPLLRLLPMLSLLTRKGLDGLTPVEIGALDEQLGSLQAALRQRADLTITRLALCESIKGYAVYQPLPEEHELVASTPTRPGDELRLYVQTKNFASVQNGGTYLSRLTCTVEIKDDKGAIRWQHHFPPAKTKLESNEPLTEYAHWFSFSMPTGLTPGSYRLTVALSDLTRPEAPRHATASIPLRVGTGR